MRLATSEPGRRQRRRGGSPAPPPAGAADARGAANSAREPLIGSEQERQMDELLRVACHELRTHLSCALLSGQLLQDEARYRGLDEATRRAGSVVSAALRMDAVLAALSESSHLACYPVEVHPQRVRLDELLAMALGALAEPRGPDSVDVSRVVLHAAPELPPVTGDPGLLVRALDCLVTHALRAAPETAVAIELGSLAGEVCVTVVDHGPGIPREELPRLFNRYHRLPGARGGVAAGVSLFVVRKIVEAHGGRVWAESEVGRGTMVGLALPAATAPRRHGRMRRPTPE